MVCSTYLGGGAVALYAYKRLSFIVLVLAAITHVEIKLWFKDQEN